MKYKILHDFLGSQDGVTVTDFKAGTEADISDYLAPHIAEWAKPVVEVENKAVITDGTSRRKTKA